jgi:hypothetical protein
MIRNPGRKNSVQHPGEFGLHLNIRNDWNEDEVNRLWTLFARGLNGSEIALKLSRAEHEVDSKLGELGIERTGGWSIRFMGRELVGMWDDSWQAERYIGTAGHVHFHPSRNRTFHNRKDAATSALLKARQWVTNEHSDFKPVTKSSTVQRNPSRP